MNRLRKWWDSMRNKLDDQVPGIRRRRSFLLLLLLVNIVLCLTLLTVTGQIPDLGVCAGCPTMTPTPSPTPFASIDVPTVDLSGRVIGTGLVRLYGKTRMVAGSSIKITMEVTIVDLTTASLNVTPNTATPVVTTPEPTATHEAAIDRDFVTVKEIMGADLIAPDAVNFNVQPLFVDELQHMNQYGPTIWEWTVTASNTPGAAGRKEFKASLYVPEALRNGARLSVTRGLFSFAITVDPAPVIPTPTPTDTQWYDNIAQYEPIKWIGGGLTVLGLIGGASLGIATLVSIYMWIRSRSRRSKKSHWEPESSIAPKREKDSKDSDKSE